MNPGRFFMPNMAINSMMRTPPIGGNNINIFNRLLNNIRTIDFGKILNGANKTLNVMNQAIPLIRQAGPMVNNAKSILHLAKVFKNETNHNKIISNNKTNSYKANSIINKKKNDDDLPTFFI